jgi:hypothetical protein
VPCRRRGEAEEEDLVAGLEVLDQPGVGVPDVPRQPVPAGPAADALETLDPHALVVFRDLAHPVGPDLGHRRVQLRDVGRTGLPVLGLVGVVPGPVAADDQTLQPERTTGTTRTTTA